jgi:hypothetical protein
MTAPWTASDPRIARAASHRVRRGECPVREQTMKADGYSEAGECVHDGENGDVEGADCPAPEQAQRDQEGQKRFDHRGDRDTALEVRHL